MPTLNEYILEYKKQIEKGYIDKAYKGIMEFMMNLRTYFQNKYPFYFVSGNIYQGYMDMTYFSFIPESFKKNKLKIAIVFIHDTISFEVWLAGYNKQIQAKYRNLFKDNSKFPVTDTIQGNDYIIKNTLTNNPNFDNFNSLTDVIEIGVLNFIDEITTFLSFDCI